MKKLIVTTSIIAAICAAGTSPHEIASTGAPASTTGAPGDGSCGNIGCHDDNTANSGMAISNFIIGSGITEYVPGETYQVQVSIEEAGVNRFGYQLVALADNDNSNAGVFNITDNQRTQLITNYVDSTLMDRVYLTYTYDGTAEYSSGLGYWTAEWTAPSSDVGPITFYYATVAANNDGTDDGDVFYLNSTSLSAGESTSISTLSNEEISIRLYPNPVTNLITLDRNCELVEVFTIEGALVLSERNSSAIDVSGLSQGNYLVSMSKDNKKQIEKIVIR